MATPTYTPLATTTLASDTATVTFSSIPAGYGDLILVANATSVANYMQYVFNSDTSANYTYVYMQGNGSSTLSNAGTSSALFFNLVNTYSSSTNAISIVQIMDYSATDKHKTVLQRTNSDTPDTVEAYGYRWANTAAITSITIDTQNGSDLASGSTFSLFGIAK